MQENQILELLVIFFFKYTNVTHERDFLNLTLKFVYWNLQYELYEHGIRKRPHHIETKYDFLPLSYQLVRDRHTYTTHSNSEGAT